MSGSEDYFYEVVEKLNGLTTAEDPQTLLNAVCDYYGLKTAAYFGVSVTLRAREGPYIMVTYSAEWVQRYKLKNYVNIDPVVTSMFSSILPVEWQARDYRARNLRDFFGEASEHGVGGNGLTIPIRGRLGERALFTVTNDWKPVEWEKSLRRLKRDFHILAYHLHQMIIRREGADVPAVKLAAREVECLRWKASGKTEWEIAAILGISEKTVRFYVSLAVSKLNAANATHAVAKAINQNLFMAPV